MKRNKSEKPFFSRYLEPQEAGEVAGGVVAGGCTEGGRAVTLRYPSDDDVDGAPTI